jgi:hypothetical protein
LIEQPAWILAKIENELAHAARAQRVDGASNVARRLLAEHGEIHVADTVAQQQRVTHGLDADLATTDREGQMRLHARPFDREPHARTDRSTKCSLCLLDGEAVVDLPSIWTTRSPVSIPASLAGPPGSGDTTVIHPSRTSICSPTPAYRPVVDSDKRASRVGVRYTLWGS